MPLLPKLDATNAVLSCAIAEPYKAAFRELSHAMDMTPSEALRGLVLDCLTAHGKLPKLSRPTTQLPLPLDGETPSETTAEPTEVTRGAA